MALIVSVHRSACRELEHIETPPYASAAHPAGRVAAVVITERRAANRAVNGAAGDGARVLRRRRPLPGGRAVVGGFLVTAAAVGIFAAYTGATTSRGVSYVVARHTLTVGQRIAAPDLTTAPMVLSPTISSDLAFRDPSRLVGALVVGPVHAGELIQASSVVAGTDATGDRELSFPIAATRAVDGTLKAGDFVDVLATYGSGADATTVAVVRQARVVARSDASATLDPAGGGGETITLGLARSIDSLAVAHAVDAGQVMLVRSTGAGSSIDSGSYQSPSAAPGR
jgi:Flp pilus assembly protein CpaB